MLQLKEDQQVADQSSIPPTSISESGGYISDLGNAVHSVLLLPDEA